jgi:hypothetical protein
MGTLTVRFVAACGVVTTVCGPATTAIVAIAGVVGGVALLLHRLADAKAGLDRCAEAFGD